MSSSEKKRAGSPLWVLGFLRGITEDLGLPTISANDFIVLDVEVAVGGGGGTVDLALESIFQTNKAQVSTPDLSCAESIL